MANQFLVGSAGNSPAGPNVNQGGNPQGDAWVSEFHGSWFTAARTGNLFKYTVASVTLAYMHLGTAGAQSFALINPVGSGVNCEMLYTDIGFLTGTTVVGAIGWFAQNVTQYPPTSPTPALSQSGVFGGTPGKVVPYSALTFASTSSPTLADLVMATASTTSVVIQPIRKLHNGAFILPPGTVAFLGNSTAAAAAGSAECAWIETPVTSGF